VIYEPWLYFEVRARLAALLRRANVAQSRQVFRAGALRVDVRARRVWVGGTEVGLTAREFDLLRVLASDPDRVFTRSELLESVWGLGDWATGRAFSAQGEPAPGLTVGGVSRVSVRLFRVAVRPALGLPV